mgnify:CR=1 FL=1
MPPRATTLDEGLEALRWADRVCTLVSVQAYRVKRTGFLKAALLEHLFTTTLPAPRPLDDARRAAECVWAAADPPRSYAAPAAALPPLSPGAAGQPRRAASPASIYGTPRGVAGGNLPGIPAALPAAIYGTPRGVAGVDRPFRARLPSVY